MHGLPGDPLLLLKFVEDFRNGTARHSRRISELGWPDLGALVNLCQQYPLGDRYLAFLQSFSKGSRNMIGYAPKPIAEMGFENRVDGMLTGVSFTSDIGVGLATASRSRECLVSKYPPLSQTAREWLIPRGISLQ